MRELGLSGYNPEMDVNLLDSGIMPVLIANPEAEQNKSTTLETKLQDLIKAEAELTPPQKAEGANKIGSSTEPHKQQKPRRKKPGI